VVAVAKTGSGKTCGYLLPALSRMTAPQLPPRTEQSAQGFWKTEAVTPSVCVLAPTRELAIQITEEAVKFAKPLKAAVVCVYGGTDKATQLRAFRGGCDVVVATPGRLNDFLCPTNGRSIPISVAKVAYLVLDEADRMLDMGAFHLTTSFSDHRTRPLTRTHRQASSRRSPRLSPSAPNQALSTPAAARRSSSPQPGRSRSHPSRQSSRATTPRMCASAQTASVSW
jgi:superfamily II DNA/RNA helicase